MDGKGEMGKGGDRVQGIGEGGDRKRGGIGFRRYCDGSCVFIDCKRPLRSASNWSADVATACK